LSNPPSRVDRYKAQGAILWTLPLPLAIIHSNKAGAGRDSSHIGKHSPQRVVKQVIIENPVINSPFAEPRRHFKFDDDGITDQIVESRRISSYFIPIAKPRKKGKQIQQTFEDWTADGIEENPREARP
jgi:hypothetical protein